MIYGLLSAIVFISEGFMLLEPRSQRPSELILGSVIDE